jgi:hypothetical protein
VVDSDPSSWAQNSGSQGAGFVRVEGRAAGGRAYTSTPRDLQPVSPGTTAGATRVLSAVASAASTQFKQRTVPAFHVDTNVHDKTPYLITDAYEGALRIGGNQSVLLAGNAAGTAGWRVDNYLVVEIEWAGGSKAFWIGNGDALSRRSERLPQVGLTSFEQGAFDITAQIPRNVDLRVRISALDYGGVGFVSDVYLVVR